MSHAVGCAFTACLQRKQKQVALKEQHLEVRIAVYVTICWFYLLENSYLQVTANVFVTVSRVTPGVSKVLELTHNTILKCFCRDKQV